MKVLLLQDVKSQGKKNQVIEVNDNYARNFLIKRNLALEATPKVLNELKQKQKAYDIKVEKETEIAKELAKKIESEEFIIKANIGENGKLFGSITVKEIELALSEKGYQIDKKQISLKDPIKSTGSFIVELKLYHTVSAKLKIIVE